MKIAICDDNEKELNSLKDMIEQYCSSMQLVYQLSTYFSGEELLNENINFDIVFLDISMKDMNGIETGQVIHKKNIRTKIIYVTSYEEYCKCAVNLVHAYAYLTKPVSQTDLVEQFASIISEITESDKNSIKVEFYNVQVVTNGETYNRYIVQVPVEEIIYIEYIKLTRKIHIHTKNSNIIISNTMTEIEKKIHEYGFETCCRGFIVNLLYINRIKGLNIYLKDGTILPISQKRVVGFKDTLNDYIQRSN